MITLFKDINGIDLKLGLWIRFKDSHFKESYHIRYIFFSHFDFRVTIMTFEQVNNHKIKIYTPQYALFRHQSADIEIIDKPEWITSEMFQEAMKYNEQNRLRNLEANKK